MVAVGVFILAGAGNSAQMIVPLSTHVHFSRSQAGLRWKQYVMSTSERPAYALTLQPEYAVGHYLVGVDLVLRSIGDENEDDDLLNPSEDSTGCKATASWHGTCDPARTNLRSERLGRL